MTFLMLSLQGFAQSTDSLSTKSSGSHFSGEWQGFDYIDGPDASALDPSSGGGGSAYITVSKSSLNFSGVTAGKTATQTFKVTGKNLSGPLSLKLTGATGVFNVTPLIIKKSQAANGVTVKVTYLATSAGSHTAKITISGTGVSSKTVNLTGTAVTRKITITPSNFSFPTTLVNNKATRTFKVTGTNLKEPIVLSTWLETTGGEYSVYPTRLPASGGTVTVTFKPLSAGSSGAQFTFTSGDVYGRITVSGTAKSVITTNKSSLHYYQSDSQQFTVKCVGANSDLKLSLSGSGANYFRLSKTTISREDAKKGVTVSVLFTPSQGLQRTTATITIRGGGADPKTVSLSYAVAQPLQANSVDPEGESGEEPIDFVNNGELEFKQEPLGNSSTGVEEMAISELARDVKIYAEGQDIVIETPVEQSAIVSDIAGHARRVNLQAGRNVIPAGSNGVHIVRVGEKSAKLMLR